MITATEALQQLKEGNQRFVNGGRVVKDLTNRKRRTAVMEGHEPFAIVDRIRPSVEPLFSNGAGRDHDKLLNDAMLANVRASVDQLRHGSAILENLVQNHDLQILGAEYSIETGQVDFFETVPKAG